MNNYDFYNSAQAGEMVREYSLKTFTEREACADVWRDKWAGETVCARACADIGRTVADVLAVHKRLRADYVLLDKAPIFFRALDTECLVTSVAECIASVRNLMCHLGLPEGEVVIEKCVPTLPFLRPGITVLKRRLARAEVELMRHLITLSLLVVSEQQCEVAIALMMGSTDRLKKLI